MIEDAKAHAESDKRKKELADLRNNADGLIYTTEKSLEEFASELGEEDVAEIRADLENLKGLLEQGDEVDVDALREAIAQLEGSAYRIAEAMYADEAEG